jgi:4-methylaminobutanoate oxidase (formaldehyde-forming)
VPADTALHVFERLWAAGHAHGLALGGFHAINACRTEKGYRHWGHDIGIEDTPLEAGLGFTCAWDKPGGFIGREALLRQREAGVPHKRLLQFRLDDETECLFHEEPLFADGQPVGVITSGMFGHRVGGSLGMGYVKRPHAITADWIANTRFEIGVGDRRVPAQAQVGAWYDPQGLRIKA